MHNLTAKSILIMLLGVWSPGSKTQTLSTWSFTTRFLSPLPQMLASLSASSSDCSSWRRVSTCFVPTLCSYNYVQSPEHTQKREYYEHGWKEYNEVCSISCYICIATESQASSSDKSICVKLSSIKCYIWQFMYCNRNQVYSCDKSICIRICVLLASSPGPSPLRRGLILIVCACAKYSTTFSPEKLCALTLSVCRRLY